MNPALIYSFFNETSLLLSCLIRSGVSFHLPDLISFNFFSSFAILDLLFICMVTSWKYYLILQTCQFNLLLLFNKNLISYVLHSISLYSKYLSYVNEIYFVDIPLISSIVNSPKYAQKKIVIAVIKRARRAILK